ncbi:MAG TPA: class II aldolase, partial [Gammaproteobacteria bacterium]|nr:class II aldolase [Gammaproteobacteria bacterium]
YGDLFDEMTASSLLKMDMDGNVIGDEGNYNEAGFTIHSGVYKARPDVQCVMHTHTRAGIAISITKKGLLPISQDAALLMGDLAYHDYGTPSTQTECEALGQSCQKANNII